MPSTTKTRIDQALTAATFLPALYILTAMWWIPEGAKYVPGAVVGAFLLTLLKKKILNSESIKPPASRHMLLLSLWAFTLYGGVIYFLHGDSWTELRAALAMAIYITVIPEIKWRKEWVYAVLIASGAGFIVQSSVFFALGQTRVGGFINPIPYATGLGAILLVTFCLGLFEEKKWFKATLLLTSLLLLPALLLTQTRGVILPIAIGLPLLAISYILRSKKSIKTLAIILVGAAVISLPAMQIASDRLDRTSKELSIIANGDYSTSIGLRLVMWEAAISIWKQHPFLGSGDNHQEVLNHLLETNSANTALRRYNPPHYHSQYFDLLVKKGVLGLIAFAFLAASILLFTVRVKDTPSKWAGLSATTLYLMAGLSDVPFRHPETVFLLFVVVIILLRPKASTSVTNTCPAPEHTLVKPDLKPSS